MTTPAQQDQQGISQADLIAAEAAFAAILTALFLAWLAPGPISLYGYSARVRRRQIEDTFGVTLRSFIQRSATDLAAASGRPNASIAAADAVQAVYPQIIQNVLKWADESYRHFAQDLEPDQVDAQTAQSAKNAGDRIGRAAAIYAQNAVRQETASRIGTLWKKWVTRHDDKVRESHHELDGQEIPLGGQFLTISGALLEYPGDPEGPPSEVYGCRCHCSHRFAPEDRPLVV